MSEIQSILKKNNVLKGPEAKKTFAILLFVEYRTSRITEMLGYTNVMNQFTSGARGGRNFTYTFKSKKTRKKRFV